MDKLQFQWQDVNGVPVLGDGEIHLWKLQLPLQEKFGNHLRSLLNSSEQARAERFYFKRDQVRFSQFRGFLRLLLGQYLGQDPQEIILGENPQGKPQLAGKAGHQPLHFNLAHSHEMGLFAFSRQAPLGVDVEKIQRPYDGEKIAGRYFSPEESSFLESLPSAHQKAEGFFRLWTLKEAYLKALGLGFQGGLDSFSIQILGKGQARLRERHPQDHWGPWHLSFFELPDQFLGALAFPGKVDRVNYLIWNPSELSTTD